MSRLPFDPRLEHHTAQFVAAGSYGILHATISDWLTPAKAQLLKAEFDLDHRCLFELAGVEAIEKAMLVGAVSHTYGRIANALKEKPSPIPELEPCENTPCDQLDWVKRWSKIIGVYNASGPAYKDIPSRIIMNGIKDYETQRPPR